MPYGLFRTSYFHISVATSVGAKRVPLAHSTLHHSIIVFVFSVLCKRYYSPKHSFFPVYIPCSIAYNKFEEIDVKRCLMASFEQIQKEKVLV